MRVTQRMMIDNLRQNIANNGENLVTLQDQLASGKRLRRPSDDPQAVGRTLTLKAESGRVNQYLRNISRAKGWLEASDTALSQISDVLTKARDIALRGGSDTMGSDERQQLAKQVDTLLKEAEQAANTTNEGKYLFAGRKVVGAVPYTAGNPSTYAGDDLDIEVEISQSVVLPINVRQSEVSVDITVAGVPTPTDVLEATLTSLQVLKDQLDSGAQVTSAQLDDVTNCLDGITDLRGSVGARMARLDATNSSLTEQKTVVASQLSREQDTDVAEVMTKLMMQQNVYQAALSVGAKAIQPSLLDFLQ